jgi:hypothetical protein
MRIEDKKIVGMKKNRDEKILDEKKIFKLN